MRKASARLLWLSGKTGTIPARYKRQHPARQHRHRYAPQGRSGQTAGISVAGSSEKLVSHRIRSSLPRRSKRMEAVATAYAKQVSEHAAVAAGQRAQAGPAAGLKFASIDRSALTEIGFNLFSRNPTTSAPVHRAVPGPAIQPVAVSESGLLQFHRQLRRPVEPVHLPARPEYGRDYPCPPAAKPPPGVGGTKSHCHLKAKKPAS